MNISNIRRTNAIKLLSECFDITDFANRLDMPPARIVSVLRGRNGEEPMKNIGKAMAEVIEDAFEKPRGWLDEDHNPVKLTLV